MYENPNAVMYWDSKRWIVRLTLEPDHMVEIPYDAWVTLSATQFAVEEAVKQRFNDSTVEGWDGLECGPTLS